MSILEISKSEALKIIERTDHHGKRIPFHLQYVTADRATWKKFLHLEKRLESLAENSPDAQDLKVQIDALDFGGRIIEHDTVIISGSRGLHAAREKAASSRNEATHEGGKHPHHWENRTRNFKFLPSDQIRKAHISLITEVNHKRVLF